MCRVGTSEGFCFLGSGQMTYLTRIEDKAATTKTFQGGLVEGANVRTPCGPRRVELVRPGDLIVTRDTGLQPVRMVWSRSVTYEDININPDLAPIRLQPRAVGPLMPQHHLSIAPDHRILVPGYRLLGQDEKKSCLIEARELADTSDAAYVDRSRDVVRYFTFVFDSHQIFCANGLPVESFLPTTANIAALNPNMKADLIGRFPQLRREPNSYPPAEYTIVSGAEYLPEHA